MPALSRGTALVPGIAAALLVSAVGDLPSQERPAGGGAVVLRAMRDELTRSMTLLRRQAAPPYFISYDITEVRSATVRASFGAIVESSEDRSRVLDANVRVGDYRFDNTHALAGGMPDFETFMSFGRRPVPVPLDDDAAAIRAVLWYQTDLKYRRAAERLALLRTNAAIQIAAEDTSPDFSPATPAHHVEPVLSLTVDRGAWERKLRRYTAPFAAYEHIYQAEASLHASVITRWYVDGDGSEIQTSQPAYRLFISAFSKADDGMELPRYESFFALDLASLPGDSAVLAVVRRMIVDLEALRRAPVLGAYTGPALLSGRASAVFFHEVFGHRIEGQRQKREDDAQTFRMSVNQRVLPDSFSVYSDPTLTRMGGTDLAGSYRFDDQGVAARRVTVVERGVLRTFLMSRAPIEGFAGSNGHGRKQPGFPVTARQSNLIVQAAAPRTREELRRQLLEQIRREGKPFGLFFDDIEGGFTITERGIPNAFDVIPVMVYRVFPDGREELVRGVDFVGTPLTVFSRITAADDRVEVFNGMCGAESGYVPVAAVSPGLLVAQVEVQRKPKSQERPPLLPAPDAAGPRP